MIQQWGYSKVNGPSTWCKHYPAAVGKRQSPVDIKPTEAVPDNGLPKLFWNYIPENVECVVNTGFGWKVTVNGKGSELSGGPLEGQYMLDQFHCHWGDSDEQGSEHTVNGKAFAAELHLVHVNLTKYSSFEEAIQHPDGLCVLGIFLTPGKKHPELDKVTSKLSSIRFKDMSADVEFSVDPASFIPKSSAYWTYHGSLTTPPCSECVIWIVFQEPVEVSLEQLHMLRTSTSCCLENLCECSKEQCTVNNNYRPTVPLGQRIVKKCNQY